MSVLLVEIVHVHIGTGKNYLVSMISAMMSSVQDQTYFVLSCFAQEHFWETNIYYTLIQA